MNQTSPTEAARRSDQGQASTEAGPVTRTSTDDSSRSPPLLAIVVPCHNEQETLPATTDALLLLLKEMTDAGEVAAPSFICYVDDGSSDETWPMIAKLSRQQARVRGLKLSRNFGHQPAVLAGMFECTADAVVTIDADLQDDETCIRQMVRAFREGSDVVLGVRDDRTSDTLFKRFTAVAYYRFLKAMGARVVHNHADYRLLSSAALKALQQFSETNLFLRGVVPLLGMTTTMVTYRRRERTAGYSKYNLTKMITLAWEGVTSFSAFPLRVVAATGAIIALGAFLMSAWALWIRLFMNGTVPGWASTVLPIYFIGGVQILCVGIVGEYVGKIYLETKRRPRYLVELRTWDWTTDADASVPVQLRTSAPLSKSIGQ